jgi:hypothetical protein
MDENTSSTNDVAEAFVQRRQADIIGVFARLGSAARHVRSRYHPSVMDYYLKQSGVL